jgi:hypothetical protein
MDVLKVLGDLRAYKAQLDEAIAIFDRLARERGKRGRPVKAPSAPRSVSPETRQKMAAAQRKRWALGRKRKAPKSKS